MTAAPHRPRQQAAALFMCAWAIALRTRKTASGPPGENPNKATNENGPEPRSLCRVEARSLTIIVSGIPYWPNRDPLGEKGWVNLYGFVRNSPITFGDLLGLDIVKEGKFDGGTTKFEGRESEGRRSLLDMTHLGGPEKGRRQLLRPRNFTPPKGADVPNVFYYTFPDDAVWDVDAVWVIPFGAEVAISASIDKGDLKKYYWEQYKQNIHTREAEVTYENFSLDYNRSQNSYGTDGKGGAAVFIKDDPGVNIFAGLAHRRLIGRDLLFIPPAPEAVRGAFSNKENIEFASNNSRVKFNFETFLACDEPIGYLGFWRWGFDLEIDIKDGKIEPQVTLRVEDWNPRIEDGYALT